MKKYYYLLGDVEHGPLTLDDLIGKINLSTLVRIDGNSTWKRAENVAEIVDAFADYASSVIPLDLTV